MSSTVVFLAAVLAMVNAATLPDTFKRCKVSKKLDLKPNECLKTAVQQAIDHLSINGSKELGVHDFDPLKIDLLTIDQGGDRPVSIKLSFSNGHIYGLSTCRIQQIDGKLSSPEGFEMNMKLMCGLTRLYGHYQAEGKILILPITGSGMSNLTMSGVTSSYVIKGEPQRKNGKTYLNVTSTKLEYKPVNVHFDLENLFNGNKELGDNMNKFLNENWEEVFAELKENAQEAFGKVYEAYAKRILERVQFKNLFIVE